MVISSVIEELLLRISGWQQRSTSRRDASCCSCALCDAQHSLRRSSSRSKRRQCWSRDDERSKGLFSESVFSETAFKREALPATVRLHHNILLKRAGCHQPYTGTFVFLLLFHPFLPLFNELVGLQKRPPESPVQRCAGPYCCGVEHAHNTCSRPGVAQIRCCCCATLI